MSARMHTLFCRGFRRPGLGALVLVAALVSGPALQASRVKDLTQI